MPSLPSPMLARAGSLPKRDGYAYEVKWDGFRAIVSTVDFLRVRSRRGWDMADLVPELSELPSGLVLDGELVAWGADGLPSFPRLCERMLHGRPGIPVTLMVFDVLATEGEPNVDLPYWQRRRLLDGLDLAGPCW
jgi:bifunctional non-homologous end joining protein LigD